MKRLPFVISVLLLATSLSAAPLELDRAMDALRVEGGG